MTGARVCFNRSQERFEVIGHGWFGPDGAGKLGWGPIAVVGPASITSLQTREPTPPASPAPVESGHQHAAYHTRGGTPPACHG